MHRLLRGLAAGDKNGGPIRLAMLLYDEVSKSGFTEKGVFQAYYNWITTKGFDTGPTFEQVCFYVRGGCDISQAVELTHWDMNQKTAGVGPAHRATPLALFYRGSALDDVVCREAKLSHYSSIASETSVVAARLCSHLLDGFELEEAIHKASVGMQHVSLAYLEMENRNKGGFGPNVLQTALSFLREGGDFAHALNSSLQFAGPNNYCPVLVGSIGGCLFDRDENGQPW